MNRDYFGGCDNVPLFDIGDVPACVPGRGPTAAEIVALIVARRDCTNGGQLELPPEFLPVPDGALFA